MDFWVQLLSIIAAIISAALTYYFTKKNQINLQERHLKEKFYIEYIKALSDNVLIDNIENAKNRLADWQNQLLLVGSSEVVIALMNFHNYIKPSSRKEHGIDNNIHDMLLTELIKAMRNDLYSNRRINLNYPVVHLTGRISREED